MGSRQGRKVRVIAKIREFTDLEVETGGGGSKDCISVQKPNGDGSETVTISFKHQPLSQNESYKVDYCYKRNEGNDIIFSREVKPLISGILDGHDATIIAYGAKGSGKTYLIQGSEDEPGLAVQAMAELLPLAEESGKLISISSYEILKERAYDLLDPKKPEVAVLNDAQGKIQLKGLSQVPVKSILEFQKLFLSGRHLHKPLQKTAEPSCRTHKGLIIHVFPSERSDTLPLGKMNFIDLAGYEDGRRKSTNGLILLENTKINKPIYALQNVVHALIANKSHVPYRESTLTRMLRTSLGGTNKILMVACLTPLFCQDSVYMVNLASRSCLGTSQTVSDSTKRNKSSARLVGHSSLKSCLPRSVSSTVKKQTGSRVQFSERKVNSMASAIKGRKLFTETCHSTKSKKGLQKLQMQATFPDIISTIEHPVQEEDDSSLCVEKAIITCDLEPSPLAALDLQETTISDKGVLQSEENHDEVVPPGINSGAKALFLVDEGHAINKENNNSLVNESASPPISERLQELSNNLKLLYSSIPSRVEIPPKNDAFNAQFSAADTLEPKTPEPSLQVNNKWELANISSSPWQTFSMRSSGVKNSLVQEYLRFLNTANKEELKKLKGIGEKRATYILELREESSEPFKDLADLNEIGLSAKQIKGMMKKEMGGLFH